MCRIPFRVVDWRAEFLREFGTQFGMPRGIRSVSPTSASLACRIGSRIPPGVPNWVPNLLWPAELPCRVTFGVPNHPWCGKLVPSPTSVCRIDVPKSLENSAPNSARQGGVIRHPPIRARLCAELGTEFFQACRLGFQIPHGLPNWRAESQVVCQITVCVLN